MNLNIKTTGTSLTPAIRDYFEKKLMSLGKIVNFDNDNVLVQAELGKTTHHHKSGDFFRAVVNLSIGGHSYRAESEKDDLYAAIDDVKDELMQEIKSSKEKHTAMKRKGSQEIKNMLHTDIEAQENENDTTDEKN
jgi:putative sigma-54 modulation protein